MHRGGGVSSFSRAGRGGYNTDQNNNKSTVFTRQATILRKNLMEWDRVLRSHGEEWPKTLGRLNAALNQTGNLNNAIHDVLEHSVYVPKQATANAQDIPFFLSTRLDESNTLVDDDDDDTDNDDTNDDTDDDDHADGYKKKDGQTTAAEFSMSDPVDHLVRYEKRAADLANDFESNMIRF